MAFTQEQLDALEAQISIEQRVRFSDSREVEYRSISDIIKLRDTIKAEVNPPTTRCTYASFSKD